MRGRVICGLFLLCTISVRAAEFTGTWRFNAAKSKPNGLVSQTMKIKPAQDNPQASVTIVDSVWRSGEKVHQEIYRTFDGKEHPATGSGFHQGGASEICDLVNATTRRVRQKRDGSVVSEIVTTLSADGKTMTSVRKGDGDEMLVFDRQ